METQRANTNYLPHSLAYWQHGVEGMVVSELVRKSVVSIGTLDSRGQFVLNGTGFLILIDHSGWGFPFIVTAKHVIDEIATPEARQWIYLRVNTKTGFRYMESALNEWCFHPDHVQTGRKRNYIDVAVYRPNLEDTDLTHVPEGAFVTPEIIKTYSLGIGDEVVLPGMFFHHVGEIRNIPIIRVGNIARMVDREKVPTNFGPMEAYLIEARSIGGLSGSPVFIHMGIRPVVDQRRPPESKEPYFFIGLVHGHYAVNNPREVVLSDPKNIGDMNAGIAIVVPVEKITETILRGQYADAMEAAVRARDTMSHAVADGTGGAAKVAPTDDNPSHKEDFTRLLGAAAKSKQSGGGTSPGATPGNSDGKKTRRRTSKDA